TVLSRRSSCSPCRCYAAARAAVLSFPTRRSSDLFGEGTEAGEAMLARFDELEARLDSVKDQYADMKVMVLQSSPPTHYIQTSERSEEHTSELQSRFDLVCRLLLDKKKRQGAMIAQ